MIRTFKALVFPVGCPAEVRTVPDTVEGMQSLIAGGYVEKVWTLERNLALYADEDGLRKELPRNVLMPAHSRGLIEPPFWLVGPVFVARTRGSNFVDVTDDDVARHSTRLVRP